jgi:hypothetical protein
MEHDSIYLYPVKPPKLCLNNIGTGHLGETQAGYDVKPAPVEKEVCEQCLYEAQDNGAEDIEAQRQACLMFGDHLPDHECVQAEIRESYGGEDYKCYCKCSK